MPPYFANPIRSLAAALAFFTRLPMPGRLLTPDAALGQSAWAFPLAGALVGGVGAGTWLFALHSLNPLLAALVAVIAQTLLTGALHEDGLADTADGFGGGCDKAHALIIMRDSRIGSYGVLALIFCISLRISALLSFADSWQAMTALVLAGTASRAVLAVPMQLLPPARADGLAANARKPGGVQVAAALLLAALLILGLADAKALLIVSVGGTAAAGVTALLAYRKIGGITGDVLGAMQQAAECAILVLLSARL